MITEEIFKVARGLANIRRYSREYSHHPESVLEHCGFIGIYSLFLGARAVEQGYPVDFTELLTRALLHDIEEGITGDVPRTTKHYSDETRTALSVFDAIAARQAITSTGISSDWIGTFFESWNFAKDETIPGQIIAVADLAATVYHVENEYVTLGNRSYIRVLLEVEGFLKKENTRLLASNEKFQNTFIHDEINMLLELVNDAKLNGGWL